MKWQIRRFTNVALGVEIPSDIYELYDHFNAYRAEIIDSATYIENMLDAVLCDALAG